MKLLLDTHLFLWSVTSSRRLKPAARRLLESADEIFVSAASIWEIAIKTSLGKVVGDLVELAAAIEASGFAELPIRSSHAVGVAALPPHHADPFDRILVAQALAEPLRLVTADPVLSQYGELVILVPS